MVKSDPGLQMPRFNGGCSQGYGVVPTEGVHEIRSMNLNCLVSANLLDLRVVYACGV